MEQNGFTVVAEDVQNLTAIKARYHVPSELHSCHTAIVDGYIIEGHVPVADLQRLLNEQPDVIGIAVAGMPQGSPGMGSPNGPVEPFDVVAFDENGPVEVFASYE